MVLSNSKLASTFATRFWILFFNTRCATIGVLERFYDRVNVRPVLSWSSCRVWRFRHFDVCGFVFSFGSFDSKSRVCYLYYDVLMTVSNRLCFESNNVGLLDKNTRTTRVRLEQSNASKLCATNTYTPTQSLLKSTSVALNVPLFTFCEYSTIKNDSH